MAQPGLFSHPLFDAILAAQVGSNIAQSEQAAQQRALLPDVTTERFKNYALQTGQITGEVPRPPGLFTNIGEKLGLIGPNYEARPKDIGAEIEAIQGTEKIQLDAMGKLDEARVKLGPKGFAAWQGTPAGQAISQMATGKGALGMGGTTLDLSAPTPGEEKTAVMDKYRQNMYELAKKRQETETFNMWTRRMAVNKLTTGLRLGQPGYEEAEASVAGAKATAVAKAQRAAATGDWIGFSIKMHGYDFVDDRTMLPADRNKITPAQAFADPHMHLMSEKQAVDNASARLRINNLLDAKKELLPNLFVSEYLPSGKKKPQGQLTKELGERALKLTFAGFLSDDRRKFDSLGIDNVSFIHQIQGRYAPNAELQSIAAIGFPDPYGSLKPLRYPQTLEQAENKIDDIVTRLRQGTVAAFDTENKKNDATTVGTAVESYMTDGASDAAATDAALGAAAAAPVEADPGMPPPPPGLSEESPPAGDTGGGDTGGGSGTASRDDVDAVLREFHP